MTKNDLDVILTNNPALETTHNNGKVIVHNTDTDRWYSIASDSLPDIESIEISELLTGRREVDELVTISRIVGYWSRISNWNLSKIGELQARRKGNYSMPKV